MGRAGVPGGHGHAHHHDPHNEREAEPAEEAEVGEQTPDLKLLEHHGVVEVQHPKVEGSKLHPDGGEHAGCAPEFAHRGKRLVPFAGGRHRRDVEWCARVFVVDVRALKCARDDPGGGREGSYQIRAGW